MATGTAVPIKILSVSALSKGRRKGLDSTGVWEKVESPSAFGFGYFLTYHVQRGELAQILLRDISNG
jgi:hypothetical protein